ncbi:MAG: hypothetical protein RIC80_02755 [Cyclobacteriaceae bacterium]
MPDLLDQLLLFVKKEVTGRYTDIDNFISIMKISVFWLIVGLIFHLVTRGIWIGLVGLSFVLPDGINKDRLRYAREFNSEVDDIPDLNRLIIKWEKICSSIFSISFLLFMTIFGAYAFLFVFLVVPFFLIDIFDPNGKLEVIWDIYSMLVIGVSLVALIDFLTFGLVKKIPILSYIYFPVTRIVRIFSLSSLYRPIYYTWASHINRWVFISGMVLFLLANYVLADRFFNGDRVDYENSNITMYHETMGQGAYSGYYQDSFSTFYSMRAQIPSDIIVGDVLRVFLPLSPDYEEIVKKNCGYGERIQKGQFKPQAALECHQESYLLSINDSTIESRDFRFNFQQSTQQKGLLTWIDISTIPEGLNDLRVDLILENDTLRWAQVPFYKTKML